MAFLKNAFGAVVVFVLVSAGINYLNRNASAAAPNAGMTGTMSISSDFCTFDNGSKDYCWIPQAQFEISNTGSARLDDVVVQVDFYDCTGVVKADQSTQTCKARARVHFGCLNMFLDGHTKAGCATKSYERGQRPFSMDEWMWTGRVVI